MALSIKSGNAVVNAAMINDFKDKIVYEFTISNALPPHLPSSIKGFPSYSQVITRPIHIPAPPAIEMPEMGLSRALNYYADYGGCGHWRMAWPEQAMNIYSKACMSNLTSMVLDKRFYEGVKTIKFQRQASPIQLEFFKQLHLHKKEYGYRMVYEVDDVVFEEDIPEYNSCKTAFVSGDSTKNILEMMAMSDEVTVTCPFMKEYYIKKTGNKRITVIPNYPPRSWLDRFYNPVRVAKLYDKFKQRPRVIYAGSGTHIDAGNRAGLQDDFSHVVQEIIKARRKFKFVWKSCYPLAVKPFIDNGEMEFAPWVNLNDHPRSINELECNMGFAPLLDNNFNKSKSDIKILEYGAFGMPSAFQDIVTYEGAEVKFVDGPDLISKLEYIHSDVDRYMKLSENIHKYLDGRWLEDHLDVIQASYFTEWGSKERNLMSSGLISLNPDQKI